MHMLPSGRSNGIGRGRIGQQSDEKWLPGETHDVWVFYIIFEVHKGFLVLLGSSSKSYLQFEDYFAFQGRHDEMNLYYA